MSYEDAIQAVESFQKSQGGELTGAQAAAFALGFLEGVQEAAPKSSSTECQTPPLSVEPAKASSDEAVNDDGTDWSAFSVESWRGRSLTFFDKLYLDTPTYCMEVIKALPLDPASIAVVEIGSGTGEALAPIAKSNCAAKCLGIDINPKFIEHSNAAYGDIDQLEFAIADGTVLGETLNESYPTIAALTKVVICVGNSIGIIPEPIKTSIIKEMADVAGEVGRAVLVYFNGNVFADGVENFYRKNPALCGEIKDEKVDLQNTSLESETGYKSKWMKPAEAVADLEKRGFNVHDVTELGKGVAVVFQNCY